ncbi:MAG: DUF1553 domain-containing protein [Planctomycetia bacterium]|nr:DUF1553 domain-containing protein [Planctomycetia bacterium]
MIRTCLSWTGSLFALLLGAGEIVAGESNLPAPSLPSEPLFSRHIVPLFGRLGCNAGACHGAVQGKNGFRLSLFGADPASDHERLRREFGGRRLNFTDPAQSLLLLKATGQVPHEGGKRLLVGGAEYQSILGWIARGAPLDPLDKSKLTGLLLTPEQQTLRPGASYRLQVLATFADGSQEDVTALSTFESRDGAVATVSLEAHVQGMGPGSAALLARFRGQPVVSRVFVPAEAKAAFPEVKEHNFIDRHVLDRLRQLHWHPAELCDDVTFLRRVSLDVTGALPPPDEIRAYSADRRADKRNRKIDELLSRPDHAALWATKFCDILKPHYREDDRFFSEGAQVRRFYEWFRTRLQENVPYDQIVERILTATSAEGRTKDEVLKELEAMALEDAAFSTDLKAYASRRTLDLYWLRPNAGGVPGTIQIAHAFLGLRLQCAECHRHPTDVWQQDDLLSFANFFMRVGRGGEKPSPAEQKQQAEETKKLTEQVKKLRDQAKAKDVAKDESDRLLAEAADLEKKAGMAARFNYLRSTFTGVAPAARASFASVSSSLGKADSKTFRLLGAATAVTPAPDQDPRELVVAWMRKTDNPYFAKAIVNRVWAHYMGRGIVDPPDDLSPLNPPTHPELLDELCRGFIASKYDLKWLHRTILVSRTYQQSSQANASSRADAAHYSRFALRRLPAEVLVDAINHATGGSETYPAVAYVPPGTRAIEVPGDAIVRSRVPASTGIQAAATSGYALELFGRPRRDSSNLCDCDREGAPSLVQGLYLAAFPDLLRKVGNPQGRAAQIVKDHADDARRIEEVFLWTLARLPTASEQRFFREHLQKSPSGQQGVEDVLWLLLNTREFLLNH